MKVTINKESKVSIRVVNRWNWFFYYLSDKISGKKEKLMMRKTLDYLRDYYFFVYEVKTGYLLSAYTRDYEYISYSTEEIADLTKTTPTNV